MGKINGKRRYVLAILLSAVMAVLSFMNAFAAEYSYAYPKASDKKGLYVCPGMEEDALELGIGHATINLSVGDFMPAPVYRNQVHCIPFSFEGSTYWFSKEAVGKYDAQLNRLAQGNVLVTAILLLPRRTDDLQYLINPDALAKQANYYQWNMNSPDAVRALRAIVTFFQKRYAGPSGARIVGWIVGNEVNNSGVWNWAGNLDTDAYMGLYAAQAVEVANAARSVYANARVYISLDHFWSSGNGDYWYAGKEILSKFASAMAARGYGKGSWCIAYHPYNISQYEPNIMSSSDAVTDSEGTRIITMKNLGVLTGYVKSRYGERCRILLSEQGYSSVTAGRDTSAEQARNIALAYYIAAQNSMVDALILHRQVDHTGEEERFGLYTSWGGENAALPKQSWSTYKYANTTAADPYMKYAARQARALSGQKVTKSLKVKRMALQPIGDLNWKRNFTGGFAAFGALADFRADQGGFLLTHDFSRNPNVPWGMVRQGRINCRKRTKFGFGIQVSASQSGSANIYLRLWAGPSRYLDASATVPCGTQNQLYVDVKNWKYRGNITKAEFYIRPAGGGWTEGTYARIFSIGTRK